MSGHDASHRSYNADASGPNSDDAVSELWGKNQSLGRTDILASPTVAQSRLYIGCGKTAYCLDVQSGDQHWSKEMIGYVNKYTPAIDGDSMYISERGEPSQLWSLSTADGTVQWVRELAVVSSPIIHKDRVYVVVRTDAGDHIHALSRSDGSDEWTADIGTRPSRYDTRTSPAIGDDTLYMATTIGTTDENVTGRLYALNVADGTKRWQYDDIAGTVTRSGVTVGEDSIYIGDNDGTLYAIDPATQSENWSFSTDSRFWTTPAIGHGLVYAGTVDGTLFALTRDGTVEWEAMTNLTYANPAVGSEGVYTGGMGLLCFNPKTGETLWKYNRQDVFSNHFTSPIVFGDVVGAASCLKKKAGQPVYDDYVTIVS